MTDLVTIEGFERKGVGKGYCRKIRAKGLVPANLLEKGTSKLLEIDPKWLSKAWKSGKTFNLKMGAQELNVSIKELQVSPTKRTVVHVDLMPA